jgi:hypothetical protein
MRIAALCAGLGFFRKPTFVENGYSRSAVICADWTLSLFSFHVHGFPIHFISPPART